jgi:capsular polysaccharide biosynthesis protein
MVVQLEQMSFADQMQLFESAACIVAPHGAGLANLVFCKTDTSVIEIFPPAPVNVCYWLLSQQVSLLYHYILGEPDSPGPDIRVDLNKLEHTVDLALASMPSHR